MEPRPQLTHPSVDQVGPVVSGGFVDLQRPVGAPEGIDFFHGPAAEADGQHRQQHRDHHQCADR